MKRVLISFTFFIILIIKINTLQVNLFHEKEDNENGYENMKVISNDNNNLNTENSNDNNVNNFDLINLNNPYVYNLLQQYLNNPYEFISNHNNKESFLAIFSNHTKTDTSWILDEYLEKNKKEIQNVIDKINNFQNNYIFTWEYDIQKRKFILPDEIKNYDDFNKWLIILSILRTMNDVPFKYILDDKNKKDSSLNDKENKILLLNQENIKLKNTNLDLFENPKSKKQRSFLQDKFEILNPPNL